MVMVRTLRLVSSGGFSDPQPLMTAVPINKAPMVAMTLGFIESLLLLPHISPMKAATYSLQLNIIGLLLLAYF